MIIKKDEKFNSLSTKIETLDADLQNLRASQQEKQSECLTSAQIEQWLDNSLKVCIDENLSATAGLKKFHNSKSMHVFEIDRMTLNNFGVPASDVERLYRALYVNSIGFYDIIKQSTASVTS